MVRFHGEDKEKMQELNRKRSLGKDRMKRILRWKTYELIKKIKNQFLNFLVWRSHAISDKHFVMILSLLVGFFCAVAALILSHIINSIHELVRTSFDRDDLNYLYLATPVIGILFASLYVRCVVKDDISHGVTKILYAISQNKAIIKAHNMWSSIIASSLTIGFGGSVGAEAPIVLTGSAIGSNLGRLFNLQRKTMMLLVGCGAAGAVAGIFKAPLTGVIFTLEVLMLDLNMSSIVPLLISAATAAVCTFFFTGNSSSMFEFVPDPFQLERVPYYIFLGVVCGFVSLYFTRGMSKLESFFASLDTPWKKFIVGSLLLAVLIFFLPPLYGEGYDTISYLLNNQVDMVTQNSVFYDFRNSSYMLVLFLVLVVFFKIFASAATNGSGGTGGIFAPSLFMGCVSGYIVAYLLNFFGIAKLPEKNFALAGMAGVMSGVMHAPMTGTFLIAELTGGFGLFLSLMITATMAYITIVAFEPHSLYAMRLAKKGELLTHHSDNNVLTLLELDKIVETDLRELRPENTLGDVVEIIKTYNRNFFPVLDHDRRMVGVLHLDEIRNVMFRTEYYDVYTVSKLMNSGEIPHVVRTDSMVKVMQIFEKSKLWNLPVFEEDGRYAGFVSKSKIFSTYRDMLVALSSP